MISSVMSRLLFVLLSPGIEGVGQVCVRLGMFWVSCSFFSFLHLVNSLKLFLCNVGVVDRNLRGFTKSDLHEVLATVAAGEIAKILAKILVATLVRSSSTAAIVIIDFMGTNLLALARSVNIVVKTGVNAAIAT